MKTSNDNAEPARKPGRPRSVLADQAILEATWAEVGVDGLSGFSVDRVASRAGVSKATIYRRWPTKEALVLDAWGAIEADVNFPDTGSLRGDLVAAHALFEERDLHQPLAKLLPQMVAASKQNPELAAKFREFITDQRAPFFAVLERARERGEIRSGLDFTVVASMLEGPYFLQLLIGDELMPADVAVTMIDLFLNGITPR